MKKLLILFLSANLFMLSSPMNASERTRRIFKADITERLENIAELKKDIRSLKLRLKTFDIAIEEAKAKPASHKATYNTVKKMAEVVTTISLLVVTVEAYRTKGPTPSQLVKPASVIASISSAVTGVSGVLADLSANDLELLNNKIKELKLELAATEKNLNEESHLLCKQEPSNQMCLNFIQ